MSGARAASSTPLVLGAAAVLLLGALLVLGGREPPVDRTATGMKGVIAWLRANEVSSLTFSGGANSASSRTGLRILPLYDTDLRAERKVPEDRAGTIAQTSEIDIQLATVVRKIRNAPTLVVLPKWRTGMRALGVAHEDLLIPAREMNRVLRHLGVKGARIERDGQGFVLGTMPAPGGEHRLGLMHAQSVSGSTCSPVIGTAEIPILLFCPSKDAATLGGDDAGAQSDPGYWLLTDPDLIANHGLVWGENGQAFLTWVQGLSLKKPVVLDLSTTEPYYRRGPRRQQPDRTWQNFARLFAWPFIMVWIAFGALGLLVLWRAIVRYGPVARSRDEEPMAAKITSIDAKARLLRLADHDAALLKAHITARLSHVAAEILGPNRPQTDQPLASLRPIVQRANAALAQELDRVSEPPGADSDILRHLDAFETCIDRIRDEFGRPASAG